MTPEIVVIAGVNGAGKSSIAGAALQSRGGTCYNPDRATTRYLAAGLSPGEANARAWERGRQQLERAIQLHRHYAFETTLGGRTMTRMLIEAAARGFALRIWYAGLVSPELHIERVRERVRRGGHAIPEDRIRERWTTSRQNLIRLLPHATEVSLWDNSSSVNVDTGQRPKPVRLVHVRAQRIEFLAPIDTHPKWAKPVIAACAKLIAQQTADPEA